MLMDGLYIGPIQTNVMSQLHSTTPTTQALRLTTFFLKITLLDKKNNTVIKKGKIA
jgi:hypothetical protein